MRVITTLLPALLLLGCTAAEEATVAAIPSVDAQVVRVLPHDPDAFTQGLFFLDGELFESTGKEGESAIRRLSLETGAAQASAELPPEHFGEGSTGWGDQIFSLTWHGGIGFRWRRSDLGQIGTFRYQGEGWGLTHDGTDLILSDGTATLRFLDPQTLAERRRVRVTAGTSEVTDLNELEYVDGEILANIWRQSLIARIDPATGRVIGWISCGAIVASIGATDPDSVLNGIAWDAKSRKLYITGKNWPKLFEIAMPPKLAS